MTKFIDCTVRILVSTGVFVAVLLPIFLIPGMMNINIDIHGWGWVLFSFCFYGK
jgi:hypothetical protein